jgi:hypothetical protein
MNNNGYFDELDSNDVWYLPANDTEESVIVRIGDKFYLWKDEHDLTELVPTKLSQPIDNG